MDGCRDEHHLLLVYGRKAASPMDIVERIGQGFRYTWLMLHEPEESKRASDLRRLIAHLGSLHVVGDRPPHEIAAELAGYRLDGVLGLDDYSLAFAAELARHLGLPFNSPIVVERLTDKASQRAALRRGGLRTPAVAVLPGPMAPEKVAEVTRSMRFPAVLKPRHGAGSRDTLRVGDLNALIKEFASIQVRARFVEDFVVEEELLGDPEIAAGLGDRVSVESIVVDGSCRHLGVTGKFPLAEPFRETGDFVPAVLDAQLTAEVLDLSTRALGVLGVEYGACHTEIKLTPEGPVIIEVNGRAGGGPIDSLYLRLLDTAPIRLAALVAVGAPLPELPTTVPGDGSVLYEYWVQPPCGATSVATIGDLGSVTGLAGVREVRIAHFPGDSLDWRRGSIDAVATVRGTAPSLAELRAVPTSIEHSLEITYAE